MSILALPFIGLGINITMAMVIPVMLYIRLYQGRYRMIIDLHRWLLAILLLMPVFTIPAFAVFNFLFTWNVNMWNIISVVVIFTIVSVLVSYQAIRSAKINYILDIIQQ